MGSGSGMAMGEKGYCQSHFGGIAQATKRSVRTKMACKTVPARARDTFGKINAQMWYQRRPLHSSKSHQSTKNKTEKCQTIDSLKTTAGRTVDIITVWTVQLHGVNSWQVGTTGRDDIASCTVNSRTNAERAIFIFFDLSCTLYGCKYVLLRNKPSLVTLRE